MNGHSISLFQSTPVSAHPFVLVSFVGGSCFRFTLVVRSVISSARLFRSSHPSPVFMFDLVIKLIISIFFVSIIFFFT
jgi:hypothetical protein